MKFAGSTCLQKAGMRKADVVRLSLSNQNAPPSARLPFSWSRSHLQLMRYVSPELYSWNRIRVTVYDGIGRTGFSTYRHRPTFFERPSREPVIKGAWRDLVGAR